MSRWPDPDLFAGVLREFAPTRYIRRRALALYSASIAMADERVLTAAVDMGRRFDVARSQMYEVVLQSYLFLGFPRMLIAAENLARGYPSGESPGSQLVPVDSQESATWFERGRALCGDVYGHNYDLLRTHVEAFAPEIFRWMIIEGYGKVLSRPGLDPVARELAIVACLIVENRGKQLASHIRGALNVGADLQLVRQIIDDLRTADEGHDTARAILDDLEGSS